MPDTERHYTFYRVGAPVVEQTEPRSPLGLVGILFITLLILLCR